LKVTLKLIRTDDKSNAFRYNLDLYNSMQTEQLIEKASEALDVSSSETSAVVNNLITALENYRSERLESMKPKQPEKRTLSEADRKAAITFLKSPNLLSRNQTGHCRERADRGRGQQPDRLPDLYEPQTAYPAASDVPGC
jgi:hypothetical protein